MSIKPIILTGLSCAGKSTIAKELRETGNYIIVDAITTRPQRKDDFNYKYWGKERFEKHIEDDDFLIHTTYLNYYYGILKSDYDVAISKNKTPILILSVESVQTLLNDKNFDCTYFFIDADDDLISERYKKREIYNKEKYKALMLQNYNDRTYSNKANYVIKSTSNNLEDIIQLIDVLVHTTNIGGGLSGRIIKLMLRCGMLLDNATESSVKGASYDLLLGDEYYYDGKIKHLTNSSSFLTIEPYDYAIVSCKESARIPRDIIGKFGLTVGLFCQGIILSNGPQIDPGFNGTLFCLLFNTSNRAVHLKRGMHYATIEFNKLLEPAPPYEGNYQGKSKIIDYIPANALHGAINELKKEIEKLKSESRIMQNIYLGVVALMFAILSILLVLK